MSDNYRISISEKGESGALVAAITIDRLTYGLGISYTNISSGRESAQRGEYSSSSPHSSEDAYDRRNKNLTWSGGALVGSTSSLEVSLSGTLSSLKVDDTHTRSVYDDVPASNRYPEITSDDGSLYEMKLDVRKSLTENLLAGVRISRTWSSVAQTLKASFSSGTDPVYQEPKSEDRHLLSTELTAGVSWTFSKGTLIALEYAIMKEREDRTKFFVYPMVLQDGRDAQIGDEDSRDQFNTTTQYLRLGGEIPFLQQMIVRLGGEAIWSSLDRSNVSSVLQSGWTESGWTDAAFDVTGGFSWKPGQFRFDYSIVLLSSLGQILPHTEQFLVATTQKNILFRHNLTVVFQL